MTTQTLGSAVITVITGIEPRAALPVGFHFDIPADHYHADPCEAPSLSASIAKVMIEHCPARARMDHPRLAAQPERSRPSRDMELGSVAHRLILGRGARIVPIDAENYTTKDAKAQRESAYDAGFLPILMPDYEEAQNLADAFSEQLAETPGCEGWQVGQSEVVGVARDPVSGTLMRSMFDRIELHDDHAVIWDIKTTGASAAPWSVARTIANMSYDVPVGFYTRVVELLRPDLAGRVIFRWAFIENEAPHAMTIAEADATAVEIGRRKTTRACSEWARCLATGHWPRYPARIVTPEYPTYAASAWMAREDAEAEFRRVGRSYRPVSTEIAGPC